MKEFTFTAWCNYGKGDFGESWIDVDLTDEEAEMLIQYGTQTEIYYNGFSQCKELRDVYQRIYAIAIEQMTDEFKCFESLDDKRASNPNWKIDDTYHCGINFPNEFEDMLIEDE